MARASLPILAVLLLLLAAAFGTFWRVVTVRTDMADFLPAGTTPATRLLLHELESGAAASLLLIGIEGAPPPELARLSRTLAEGLRASGRFSLVANGSESLGGGEERFLLDHRYLLSTVTAEPSTFTVDGLRRDLVALLDGLSGSAAPLVQRYGLIDPVGALAGLLRQWVGSSRVEAGAGGLWLAPGRGRALLLARVATGSLDIAAGRTAIDAVHAAFAAADPGPARLLVSGSGVFAVEAADAIRHDVRLVSMLSGVLIAAFLLWRHRSVHVLLAAAIPLAAGVVAAALVVQAVYGFLHGITLGFGMTMLGVAADYPLLLVGQRREGEPALAAARRIAPTMGLAVATAAIGLVAMLLSSFPGLSQLGLFSAVGLVVAAAVTRFALPHLVQDFPMRGQWVSPGWLAAAALLRRRRALLAWPVLAACLWLLAGGGPAFESDLANLSPVPAAARDLDEELRGQLGAPDVRHLVAIAGSDQEAVLEASERLGGGLDPLIVAGAIAGADLPSRYLPSGRTQLLRRAALPEPEALRARLAVAGADLPFRPQAFDPFLADIAHSRTLPPVTLADLAPLPVLAARLEPLLFRYLDGWYGLAALDGVRSPEAVRAAVSALGEPVTFTDIDLKAETERMVAAYTREALTWLAAGGGLLLLCLALALRRPSLVFRVAAPIAAALLVTLAVLTALGVKLTLFHLAALLLMTGVSIDYALFLNRGGPDEPVAESSRTLGSVLNCNATTLLTFGLLALCRNPVLHGIGLTVGIGVLVAVILAIGLSPGPVLRLKAAA